MNSQSSINSDFPSVAVLGSTGSVGSQALDVARRHGIRVSAISAGSNIKALEEQIREFLPDFCAVADVVAAAQLRIAVADTKTKVLSGDAQICDMIQMCDAPVILNSILGSAGLLPTLTSVRAGKRTALANKESMVVAGELVMEQANRTGAQIIPVDSEHSAVFQCLAAGRHEEVKKIILTASGGPFWGYDKKRLSSVTLRDALAHPTWNMGAKITVDSATMMNKGFEVIEAARLFGVSAEKIDVLVHRESIIHSMVEYIDNTVIAQMGVPDMRSCVQYALSYPKRVSGVCAPLDLAKAGSISFYSPDTENFPLLSAAYSALKAGGVAPAALNAADEVAVAAFLNGRISFCTISDVVIKTTERFSACRKGTPTLEEVLDADRSARIIAEEFIKAE